MLVELEKRVTAKMSQIPFGAGQKVVQTNDLETFREQSIAKVRANETGCPGYDSALQFPG